MKYIKKFNEERDFNWDDVLKDQRGGTEDKWDLLEKDIIEIVDKYSGDFGVDSYGVIDAMYQVLDGVFQKKK